MHCPCGSKLAFNDCCQGFITQEKRPSTAEQLMRSRFSAYATKNAQYIYDTYGELQRKNHTLTAIKSWAEQCFWLALEVHESKQNMVDFSAYYVLDDTLCELRERSNFALEQKQWRYLDGDIIVNTELAKVKRNEVCPCNNYPTAWSAKKGKKFKHCCAKG
ncbi:YchJ family protein [Colwelliaceae bacterium MEBiC 14330]